MFYVFLDLDGVVNKKEDSPSAFGLNISCVNNLARALGERGDNVKVVLTSYWEVTKNNEESRFRHFRILERCLKREDIEIKGRTKMLSPEVREQEIKDYVRLFSVDDYIIIDDEAALYSKDCENLFLVDGKNGFTEEDAERLKGVIVPEFKEDMGWEPINWGTFDVKEEPKEEQKKEPLSIMCDMNPTERYQDTGRMLLSHLNKNVMSLLPEVVYYGPEFERFTVKSMNLQVKKEEFYDFLMKLEEEISRMTLIQNVLDVFLFETSDSYSRSWMTHGIEKYKGELDKCK